jgi:adenylate cyclase
MPEVVDTNRSKRLILSSYPRGVATGDGRDSAGSLSPARRSGACVPMVATECGGVGRSQHQLESTARQMRVLIVTTRIGAAVSVFFGVQQFLIAHDALWLGYVNLASAVVFLLIPSCTGSEMCSPR